MWNKVEIFRRVSDGSSFLYTKDTLSYPMGHVCYFVCYKLSIVLQYIAISHKEEWLLNFSKEGGNRNGEMQGNRHRKPEGWNRL